jgi:retron-type reverse transcriptase
MKIYKNLFDEIISAENLFLAWDKFKNGKRNKKDVQLFEWNLEENIFKLHRDLKNKIYKHGAYHSFKIRDPKLRDIHKAQVRDRILHHAIFQVLNPIFEPGFISASFSCREGYGTHKGVQYLQDTLRKATQNGRVSCFALKCDIKKFFDTIDHDILIEILEKRICHSRESGNPEFGTWIPGQARNDNMDLLKKVINSFSAGLPLGNLTSQLFANVYLNELDQFAKHKLKIKYYIRYADDFVVFSQDKEYFENLIPIISEFLKSELKLTLHPNKVFIKTLSSGVDFLGWVNFYNHRILRKTTKRRMLKRIEGSPKPKTLNSYLGLLKHGNTKKVRDKIVGTI